MGNWGHTDGMSASEGKEIEVENTQSSKPTALTRY